MTKKRAPQKLGGLPFFISLACLILLSFLNIQILPILWDSRAKENAIYGVAGMSIGFWLAYIFMHGRINVFVHEFKHALISGLAGNKATGLHIKKDSGKFTYKYAKSNARYNALIALAPYCTPLFTFFTIVLSALFFGSNHEHIVVLISLGFGCDLLMNIRDISPRQTDLTNITGGFYIGVLFVLMMNIVIATYILAWIFQDWFGIKILLANLWDFCVAIFWYYRHGS